MMMSYKNLDLDKLSKLASRQVDHVTCLECCKYYIAPATASCGHTLCHTCWRGRRTCPVCAAQLERKHLKLNLPLQSLTEHVQTFGEAFEKLFKIKLDEFDLDTPSGLESEKDPDKNVKEWLTSSQNHFSAPVQSSEAFSQDLQQPHNPVKLSPKNIIIHSNSKKTTNPPKAVCVPPPQDDWDKIEPMVEMEKTKQQSENIVGPMDIEPFYLDDGEYTTENPRRSSRKRDVKMNDSVFKSPDDLSSNKQSFKDSSGENDKKSQKIKNTWSNVKRMRKEFSKLNKKNRNKLNVSIEMVKKTQNIKPVEANIPVSNEQVFTIDENTQKDSNKENDNNKENQQHLNIIENNKEIIENDLPIFSKGDVIEEQSSKPLNNKGEDNIEETNQKIKMPFIKKGKLNSDEMQQPENSDDIEISIKIGNTITNIVIKKKTNDVQIKVNNDQEVQTSLGPYSIVNNINKSQSRVQNVETNTETYEPKTVDTNDAQNPNTQTVEKSASVKKNTASADTATVQFEITDSVEKELSNTMEVDIASRNNHNKHEHEDQSNIGNLNKENIEDLNDLDIFNSGSVKEANIHYLKEPAPSEILVSTAYNKLKSQKPTQKRNRENNDDELPDNKKVKSNPAIKLVNKNTDKTLPDSEPINYDSLMGQVFANIDADIEEIRKTQEIPKLPENNNKVSNHKEVPSQVFKTQTIKGFQSQMVNENTPITQSLYQKDSENVFSVLDKEDVHSQNTDKIPQQVEELLTPVLCGNLDVSQECINAGSRTGKMVKPSQENDDSDRSVVEETPQKKSSLNKLKRTSAINLSQTSISESKAIPKRKSTSNLKSFINLTDTVVESNQSTRDITVMETPAPKQTMETPLTITKFTDQIKHKSTPVAKKSLNFENENVDIDTEQTLCPSITIAKTTQEKEFMNKVFENTQTTPVVRKLGDRNLGQKTNMSFCLAGSCLTSSEIAKVKVLCTKQKWRYVDVYTRDITHLIVGVDEEKKSQRSVKYMCALAASKWIVSFNWVQKCLESNEVVDEEIYEALDSTGEPGPRRSRIAKQKLFQGIIFYCMPPFGVLDVETLKSMLVAAGGRVVNKACEVKITEDNQQPALLLAEPEQTQEDRFIYLAMEQCIVPVNYEWVLNCLGSYTLGSIQELLLCPSSLLPAATARWPQVLITQEYD